ncbi:MAG: DUF2784 domain-containing protein [Burkholderiaceae bacterium]|nr:DUF2784 domain-containing protein [Burkholderiaceae bacterium]
MGARFAADAVLLAHGAFIAFVIVGGVLVWRWPKIAYMHIAAVIWGTWVMVSGTICPLTPLENALRMAAGRSGYEGGFIEHYVTSAIYPAGLTRSVQIALGTGVVAFNALVYGLAWRRRRKARTENR